MNETQHSSGSCTPCYKEQSNPAETPSSEVDGRHSAHAACGKTLQTTLILAASGD